MLTFVEALHIDNILTTTVGLVASSLVIYCCIRTSSRELLDYRFIIAWHAFLAFCLTLLYTALQIGICVKKYDVVVTLIGFISKMPILLTKILVVLCIFLFIMDILSLSVGFVYRYSLICRKDHLRQAFTQRYIYFVATALVLIDAGIVWLIEPVLEFSMEVPEVEHLSDLGPTVVIKLKRHGLGQLKAFCVALFIVLLVSYGIILFTFKRMLQTLKSSTISNKTRSMQKRLMLLMFLQAFLPTIFLIIPLLLFVIFLATTIEVGIYGTSVFALLYWEPCIHPVLSLYYIKPFRERLCNMVRRKRAVVQVSDVRIPISVIGK